MPVLKSLPLITGDDWLVPVYITDEEETAVDLTGLTFTAYVKHPDGQVDMTITDLDLVNGRFSAVAGDELTADIKCGQFSEFKVKQEDGAGFKKTIVCIPVNISLCP